MSAEPITEGTVTQIKRDIDSCRLKGLMTEPFIASPVMSMIAYVCRSVGGRAVKTAAVSGKRLYVNPEFWKKLIKAVRITLVMHEAWHVALGHHVRRGNRNHRRWNEACDFYINLLLFDAGFDPIPKWLFDEKFRGWSEERIFAFREREFEEKQKNQPKQEPKRKKDGKQGEGQGGGKPDDSGDDGEISDEEGSEDGGSSGSGEGEEISESQGDGEASEGDQGASDDSGDAEDSGDGGDSEGDEAGEEGDGSGDEAEDEEDMPIGEVWDAEDDDGNEMTEEEAQDELQRIKEDLQMAKNMRHKTAGDAERTSAVRGVDSLLKPKDNWSNQVIKYISKMGTPLGRSWSGFDRRSMQRGLYEPHQVRQSIGWLVALWDVSSSMDLRAHHALRSVIDSMRTTINMQRLTIVPFNSIVQQADIVELSHGEMFPKEMNVGGGTRFDCGFNWVRRQEGEPDGIFVFTDLADRKYGDEPDCPVLWVSSDPVYEYGNAKRGLHTNRPPWGDVVEIELDGRR